MPKEVSLISQNAALNAEKTEDKKTEENFMKLPAQNADAKLKFHSNPLREKKFIAKTAMLQ